MWINAVSERIMLVRMLSLLVVCWLPALCHSSCCMLAPPPVFKLHAPPRPPGLMQEPSCREAIKLWSAKSTSYPGLKVTHHHDNYLPGVGIVNHTSMYHIPLSPDEHEPVTPVTPSLSESKPVSVGMILGIVIGVLLLLLVVFLSYIFTKRKQVKSPIDSDPDQEGQHSFLHNYKIRGWPWKPNTDPGKKLRNLFNGLHKSEGCDSSTSSESGYCEEVYDEKGGKPTVVGRNRAPLRPRPTSSRPGTILDTTPDIIASTQTNELEEEDDTPKRWSLFGLLPSLKPLLVPIPGQLQLTENDLFTSADDDVDRHDTSSDQVPLKGSGIRVKPPEQADIPKKPVIPNKPVVHHVPPYSANRKWEDRKVGDRQLGEIQGGILEPTAPPRPRSQSQRGYTGSLPRDPSRQKKSRVRIWHDHSRDREIEV